MSLFDAIIHDFPQKASWSLKLETGSWGTISEVINKRKCYHLWRQRHRHIITWPIPRRPPTTLWHNLESRESRDYFVYALQSCHRPAPVLESWCSQAGPCRVRSRPQTALLNCPRAREDIGHTPYGKWTQKSHSVLLLQFPHPQPDEQNWDV